MTNGKKKALYLAGMAGCLLLVVVGLLLKSEALKALSGVCIGVGAGVFGMLISGIVTLQIESKNPEAFRTKRIEEQDERNAAIRGMAAVRTNRVMAAVIPVLGLVFVLMNVDLTVILMVCGLVLLQSGVSIFFHSYYNKRM